MPLPQPHLIIMKRMSKMLHCSLLRRSTQHKHAQTGRAQSKCSFFIQLLISTQSQICTLSLPERFPLSADGNNAFRLDSHQQHLSQANWAFLWPSIMKLIGNQKWSLSVFTTWDTAQRCFLQLLSSYFWEEAYCFDLEGFTTRVLSPSPKTPHSSILLNTAS